MILRGNKASSSDTTPTRTPDNLRSEDTMEVILGLCEGEIKGLVDGGKSLYIGDTPLLNAEGETNFGDFEMLFFPGSGVNEVIRPTLGGISNSTNVNVTLMNQTPVIRTGQSTNINFIEIRMVVQQLYQQKENGDLLEDTLEFELQYKPTSSSTWKSAFFVAGDPDVRPVVGIPGQNYSRFSGLNLEYYTPPSAANSFDTDVSKMYWSNAEPVSPRVKEVWFDSSGAKIVVKQWNGVFWGVLSTQPNAEQPWVFDYNGRAVSVVLGTTGRSIGGEGYTPGSVSYNSTVWLNSANNRPYIWRGSAWVDLSNTHVPTGQSKIVKIRGKTSSSYVKELRFPVDSIDDTYDIRINKLSIDPGQNGDTENFIVVQWESFQEVIAKDVEFPDTSCLQLVGKASGQFSSIPQFWGIYEGRLINVPSNYDPDTRIYTGVWDGTWKRAYTNNPAYIWNDIQTNDRFGRSAYYPVTPNKWDVYEAGQYCDELVPDGKGGFQPRWTFNQWVTDAQGIKELSRYLAGTFTGVYTDDGQGSTMLRVDKDRNAVQMFTPENVVDGDFKYSFSDIATRHNDITMTWINPDLLYNEDRVRVKDDSHIEKYGRIPLDLTAFGCRDRQEAFRRARAAMISATTEVTTVEFKTNRQGSSLDMYDVILIADKTLGYGVSGRVKSFNDGLKLNWDLFDPVYLEVGVSYTINIQVPNPNYPLSSSSAFTVVQRSLDPLQPRGLVTQLSLQGGSLDIPENAVFSIESAGDFGLPKPFRVIGVNEVEGDPDNVEVIALDINRTKWDYIDNGVQQDAPSYSSFLTNVVDAPRNLKATIHYQKVEGVSKRILTLSWDKSDNKAIRQYRVQMKYNNGVIKDLGLTQWTEFDLVDPDLGDYVFYVTGRTLTGAESLPSSFAYSFVGDVVPLGQPGLLHVVGGPNNTTFDVKSPTVSWS